MNHEFDPQDADPERGQVDQQKPHGLSGDPSAFAVPEGDIPVEQKAGRGTRHIAGPLTDEDGQGRLGVEQGKDAEI